MSKLQSLFGSAAKIASPGVPRFLNPTGPIAGPLAVLRNKNRSGKDILTGGLLDKGKAEDSDPLALLKGE